LVYDHGKKINVWQNVFFDHNAWLFYSFQSTHRSTTPPYITLMTKTIKKYH